MPPVYNNEHRTVYRSATKDRVLLATDNVAAEVLIAGKASHTLYITLIVVSITTVAAQSIDFQDDAGTPVEIAGVPASAVEAAHRYDFGEGVALTEGKGLTFSTSAAGVAAYIHVEGYFVQTSAMSLADHDGV